MNARGSFINTLLFKDFDRVPFMEWSGYWYETTLRWYHEGLPELKPTTSWEQFYSPPFQTDPVKDHFGLEQPVECVPMDFGPIPRFVSRVFEETKDYIVIIDEMRRDQESIPQFFEFPVRTREDWEKMKERFDPEDPRRYPKTWGGELSDYYDGTTERAIGIREYPYLGIFLHGQVADGTSKSPSLFLYRSLSS